MTSLTRCAKAVVGQCRAGCISCFVAGTVLCHFCSRCERRCAKPMTRLSSAGTCTSQRHGVLPRCAPASWSGVRAANKAFVPVHKFRRAKYTFVVSMGRRLCPGAQHAHWPLRCAGASLGVTGRSGRRSTAASARGGSSTAAHLTGRSPGERAVRQPGAGGAAGARPMLASMYTVFTSVRLCHISSTSLIYPIAPPTALPAVLPNAQPVLPPNALPAALLAPVRQPAGPCCPLRRPVHCLAQRAAGRAARADAAAGACARARAAHCAAQCNAGVMHWTAQRAAQARAQAPAAAPARGARPSALCTAGVAC